MYDGECVQRTNKHDNCLTYHDEYDACTKCSTGYLLNQGICDLYPVGIAECKIFSNKTTCV